MGNNWIDVMMYIKICKTETMNLFKIENSVQFKLWKSMFFYTRRDIFIFSMCHSVCNRFVARHVNLPIIV